MKTLILILFFPALLLGQLLAQVPNGVVAELMEFKSSTQETLPAGYAEAFTAAVARSARTAQATVLKTSAANCADKVTVDFVNSVTSSPSAVVADFEAGLVRIETVSCFKSIAASKLLSKTSDPSFRKNAFTTIKETYRNESAFCEITDAPTIGLSNYCYDVRKSTLGQMVQVESFNVWNDTATKYKSKVYYRYILESSERFENHTVYHVVSFIRSDKLNAMQRFFARQYIIDTQKNVVDLLKKELE